MGATAMGVVGTVGMGAMRTVGTTVALDPSGMSVTV